MDENDETYKKIMKIAELVKQKIDEECKINSSKSEFCEHASNIISDMLIEEEIEHRIMYGLFDCDERKSHVWIEIAEEILDVTADQFGDYPNIWYPADVEHYNCFIDIDEYLLEKIQEKSKK